MNRSLAIAPASGARTGDLAAGSSPAGSSTAASSDIAGRASPSYGATETPDDADRTSPASALTVAS